MIIFDDHFDDPLPLEKWQCEFLKCPSQCYYRIQHDGTDYVLYLRWRNSPYWQGHIISGASGGSSLDFEGAGWSNDLFDATPDKFPHDDWESAQNRILEIFRETVVGKGGLSPYVQLRVSREEAANRLIEVNGFLSGILDQMKIFEGAAREATEKAEKFIAAYNAANKKPDPPNA